MISKDALEKLNLLLKKLNLLKQLNQLTQLNQWEWEQPNQFDEPTLLEKLNQLEQLNKLKQNRLDQPNQFDEPTLLEKLNQLEQLNKLKQLNLLDQLDLLKQLNPSQQLSLLKQLDPLQVNLLYQQNQLQMSQLQQKLLTTNRVFLTSPENSYGAMFNPVSPNNQRKITFYPNSRIPPIPIPQPIYKNVPSSPFAVNSLKPRVENIDLPNLENDLPKPKKITKSTKKPTKSLKKKVHRGDGFKENNDLLSPKKINMKSKKIQKKPPMDSNKIQKESRKKVRPFNPKTDMGVLIEIMKEHKSNWRTIANQMFAAGRFTRKKPMVWRKIYLDYRLPLRKSRIYFDRTEVEMLKTQMETHKKNWEVMAENMNTSVERLKSLYYRFLKNGRYLENKKNADIKPKDLEVEPQETGQNEEENAVITPTKALEVEGRETRQKLGLFNNTIPQNPVLSVEKKELKKLKNTEIDETFVPRVFK